MPRFWGVFFVDISSADIAEQACSKMARVCKVGENMEDFKRCLANSLEPWLLILDNADDPSWNISQIFPVGNRGTIIVTSRNPDCKCHATVGSKMLHEMESHEAITLLLRSADLPSEDEDLRGVAQPIVQTLGYLALAMGHAGASIRQRTCTLEGYLDIYKRHRKKLLSSQPGQAASDYKYTVYTTWEISVDSIKELAKNPTDIAAANALELLTLFGFCHFDDITEGMFRSAWENFDYTKKYPWWASNLLGMIRDRRLSSWDSLGFNEAIQLLSSYSLIHVSGPDNRISLHPLVHSWIRDSLDQEVHLKWWNITVSTLALAYNHSMYHLNRQLKVHLRHCIGIGQVDHLFIEDDVSLDRVAILCEISSIYLDFPYKDALMLSERALEYSRKFLGDECYETCRLSYQLAIILNNLSEYQKASDLLQGSVDVSIRAFGPADDLTLCILGQLARAYRQLGRKQEALELVEKCLAICEKSLDEKDNRYLLALENVARVYSALGRNEEAIDLLKKALAGRKENLGEDNTAVLNSEYFLALAYSVSGQYQVALETFQNTLKKYSRVFGEGHFKTVYVMCGVAVEYGYVGQPEKGIPLIVEALEVGSRAGVPDTELELWKKDLERLQYQSANVSTTVSERLVKPQEQPHPEGEEISIRRRWRLWLETRRRTGGFSSSRNKNN